MEPQTVNYVLATIIIVLLIALIVHDPTIIGLSEAFSTPKDKADSLMSWFTNRSADDISYKEFICDNPDSNIVEYNKMTKLIREGGNIDSISEALRVK